MGRRLLDLNKEIKYLRDFRDNATLPMFSVAITGNILWANDAMIRMMGFAECPGDFTGSMAYDYHIDKELLSTMFNMILDGKFLVDFPCNLKRRDGTVINVTYNSNARQIRRRWEIFVFSLHCSRHDRP
jgi:PAS domain-containing protein